MAFHAIKSQGGFTLVEVIVALLIITVMSKIAIESTVELGYQARHEKTKAQHEQIRSAILGNPKFVIGGQPDISGFVSDVGRLPACLRELLEDGFCSDNSYCSDSACTDGGETWASTPGWAGPYLSATHAATNSKALSDGWGNLVNDGNYGWDVNHDTTTTVDTKTIKIQSSGKNGIIDTDDTGYDADFPNDAVATINEPDWKVKISDGVTIQLRALLNGGTPSCTADPSMTESECNAAGWTWDSGTSTCSVTSSVSRSHCEGNGGTWTSANQKICVRITSPNLSDVDSSGEDVAEDGSVHLVKFTSFTDSGGSVDYVPMGTHSVNVFKHDGTDCHATDTYPQDGMSTIDVQFIPRRQIPIIYR